MNQKLLSENSTILPKLNILIYPWLHVYANMLPSSVNFVSDVLHIRELGLWYLGYSNFSKEMDEAVHLSHLMFTLDNEEKAKIESYLNLNLIPKEYTKNDFYNKEKFQQMLEKNIPTFEKSKSILAKDQHFAKKVRQLLNEDISPGLMSDERLKQMPHTYEIGNVIFII